LPEALPDEFGQVVLQLVLLGPRNGHPRRQSAGAG
jgi:hypothetical protein